MFLVTAATATTAVSNLAFEFLVTWFPFLMNCSTFGGSGGGKTFSRWPTSLLHSIAAAVAAVVLPLSQGGILLVRIIPPTCTNQCFLSAAAATERGSHHSHHFDDNHTPACHPIIGFWYCFAHRCVVVDGVVVTHSAEWPCNIKARFAAAAVPLSKVCWLSAIWPGTIKTHIGSRLLLILSDFYSSQSSDNAWHRCCY